MKYDRINGDSELGSLNEESVMISEESRMISVKKQVRLLVKNQE